MIRVIDLGKQTSDGDGEREFAFWNTVSDMFLDYNGCQAWSNVNHFKTDLFWHLGSEQADKTFDRIGPLLPKWAWK